MARNKGTVTYVIEPAILPEDIGKGHSTVEVSQQAIEDWCERTAVRHAVDAAMDAAYPNGEYTRVTLTARPQ
jgi:hypothetical protein